MAAESIVRSKQAAEAIGGILTEVVCTIFSDHIFVVVTQYGKIGTLISVTPHIVANEVGKPTFSTKILMGKDEVRTMIRSDKMIINSCLQLYKCP